MGVWSCKSGRGSAKILYAWSLAPPLLKGYLRPCIAVWYKQIFEPFETHQIHVKLPFSAGVDYKWFKHTRNFRNVSNSSETLPCSTGLKRFETFKCINYETTL